MRIFAVGGVCRCCPDGRAVMALINKVLDRGNGTLTLNGNADVDG